VRRGNEQSDRLLVVWALPSRLIGKIGPIPSEVQLDIMSTAWATLRRLRGQPCNLLMLHLELPDSTGPALAARVRILHSDLPIVLTTDRIEAVEIGMNLGSLRLVGPLAIPVCWSEVLDRVVAGNRRYEVEAVDLLGVGRMMGQPVAQGK